MGAETRFNLTLLRGLGGRRRQNSAPTEPERARISRRSFFGFTAAATALTALPVLLRGGKLSVVRDGAKIHVLLYGEPRWTIDPARFGEKARLYLHNDPASIRIVLCEALFPGTDLPADFECLIARLAGTWMMNLAMECGIQVEAELVAWLDSKVAACGHWRAGEHRPFRGVQIAYAHAPRVQFNRDWRWQVQGRARVSVGGLPRPVHTDVIRIDHGDLTPETQIAAGAPGLGTSFYIERRAHAWRVNLFRDSAQGWNLTHDEERDLFDELRIEARQFNSGPVHSALFVQSEENPATLRLFTGGGLLGDSGEPFQLPLTNPRLAFALNGPAAHSALLAELGSEPVWAHGEHASYSLSGTDEAAHLELVDNGEQPAVLNLSPGLSEICFPDDAVAMNLKFGVPKPFLITWADLASPFERAWAILHLLPSEHAFDLYFDDNPQPDHLLQIDRPQDLLSLRFQFKNLRLITGIAPRIVLRHHKIPGQLTVIFPPQHVAEQAFFHTDDNLADPHQLIAVKVPVGDVEVRRTLGLDPTAAVTPQNRLDAQKVLDPDDHSDLNHDHTPAQTLLSGESRIVFEIPKGHGDIPFHLDSLLDWKKWSPRVAAVAQSRVTNDNYDTLPDIAEPKDVTAIELPYKLMLSPSELGRWAHAVRPATHDTNAVELWHTRLAVATQRHAKDGRTEFLADETNVKDRTVRAIWSPDYVPVDRTCTADPSMLPRSDLHPTGLRFPIHYTHDGDPNSYDNPFRMSLDSLDRCELVHLTSNYRIPKPYSTCPDKPTGDALLPPAPVGVERMMLTSIGGYLKSLGVWNPAKIDANHQLTVEQWRHIATLGRDQYVRVVYKGYLLPFGHRVSLVKVTERKILIDQSAPSNGFVAILHQRMFIVVQNPIKDYPVLGQEYSGRQLPFRRIEALTLITPDIDPPGGHWPADPSRDQTQSLFWPKVNDTPFPFRYRFTDFAGATSEASLPAVFADAAVSQNETNSTVANPTNFGPLDAIALYNAGFAQNEDDDRWTTAAFSSQTIAFAAPNKPGDTQYNASLLAFAATPPPNNLNVLELYQKDLPYFYPIMQYARISSSSITRITGQNAATRVVYFQPYISSGFNPKDNRGEVVLQVHDQTPLLLQFGKTKSVDKAGGLASPDTVVSGFSRKSGAVGGKPVALSDNKPPAAPPTPTPSLTTYSSGNFNSGDFFSGLTSAKLFGAIRLADIIAPLAPGLASNLGKAPKMLEEGEFKLEGILTGIVGAINDLQNYKVSGVNPLAEHLAVQAQRVFTLKDAVDKAHAQTQADDGNSVALLADTVAEADLDRQLVGAITDYASALTNALANPASLVEEAALSILTAALGTAVASLGLDGKFSTLMTTLQTTLGTALVAGHATPLSAAVQALQTFASTAATQTLPDTVRFARDQLTNKVAQLGTLLVSEYAPDLAAVSNVLSAATDIQTRLGNLPSTIASVAGIPSFFQDLAGILDDLLQVYQSAGFLGIVSTNANVAQEVKNATADIALNWREIDYFANAASHAPQIDGLIQDLGDSCIKLAAKAFDPVTNDPAKGKIVLQNLRQLQRAAAAMKSYLDQIQRWQNNGGTTEQEVRRLTQLLQQLERQALASLAALQTMVRAHDLDAAATLAGIDLAGAFEPKLIALAPLLTAADRLIGTGVANVGPIETRILASFSAAVGDQIAGPLGAKVTALQAQLLGIRQSLSADANNLALKLLHYDLAIQLQNSFAAGLEWITLHDLPALSSALEVLRAVNGLATAVASQVANTVGSLLCGLAPSWTTFLQAFSTGTLSQPIYNLFKGSLDDVTSAFSDVCSAVNAPAASPSRILGASQHLFNTFQALLADVRARISTLSGLPQAVLDELVAFAKQQLELLIQQIPIPTSLTYSYDWHPDIQPFEPVFLLEDGADFIVTAKATVPILSGGSPTVDIQATLTNFSINLIGTPSFVIITFKSIQFSSHNGSSPDCRTAIDSVTFGDAMSFVESLASALDPSEGPFIELEDGAIRAGFRFAVDSIPAAGMTVMGLAIEVAAALPFNGDPLRCEFGVSDQQHPFLLSFGIYGGGGFLQLQLGLDGVQLLQGALEFGLVSAITIGPLQGDGFVVGGIYFRIAGSESRVCGFVHAHGHMDIFGIISLDVDLYVAVCYDNGVVTGTATFSVHVSILFFSETFTLQASYTFVGSGQQSSQAGVEYFGPQQDEEYSIMRVSDRQTPSRPAVPKPVFISKADWEAYLRCFDLESEAA